jgi:hypothetical protein
MYSIVIDKHAIPCKSPDSIACFDELFKAHVCLWYLVQSGSGKCVQLLQTTIYEIDVDTTKVNPRAAELRARMLH